MQGFQQHVPAAVCWYWGMRATAQEEGACPVTCTHGRTNSFPLYPDFVRGPCTAVPALPHPHRPSPPCPPVPRRSASKLYDGISLYSYGAPRVGNKAFAEEFDRLVPDTWRITNANDIIPRWGRGGRGQAGIAWT